MNTVELIKKKFGCAFSSMAIYDLSIEERSDFIATYFIAKFSMLGEDVQDIHISYPATWWDAFKKEVFPSWLRKKFPPRMVYHYIDIDAVLPKFKVALPDEEIMLIKSYRIADGFDDELPTL